MKTNKLILVILGLLIFRISNGDVIPPNAHYVVKCVKITNLNDYPEISLIGDVRDAGGFDFSYIISSTACLVKGYKFNQFTVYAVSNNYLAGKDIDDVDWTNDKNAFKSNISIEPYAGYYANSNPTDSIDQFYKIMGFTVSSVILHKWKEITRFNNEKPDSVILYSYEGDPLSLSQQLTSYLKKQDLYSSIRVYPNPAKDYLTIGPINKFNGELKIEMYNANGKAVKNYIYNNSDNVNTIRIPVNRLPKGMYFVKIYFDDIIEIRKVVFN
jgi:hypothetical protein